MKRALLAALGLFLIATALLVAVPPSTGSLEPAAPRRLTYAQAVAEARAVQRRESGRVLPEAQSLLLTHGRRAGRAFVLLHGLSSCPAQFRALGERLHAGGANVWIPLVPHHGLPDRMTADLARLRAEELARFAGHQADVGAGLGDTVTVCGLSLGGAMALWTAQTRPDVERAVAVAPLVGLALLPGALSDGVRNLWLRAPNAFLWWDPRKREALEGPRYVYPRYSTRAVAEILKLSYAVRQRAERQPPAARSVVVVVNGADAAVATPPAERLVRAWRRRSAADVRLYEFPKRLALGHDVIDPAQPYQRVELVYPLLDGVLAGPAPPASALLPSR